jgi:hypothetical protein
MYGQQQSPFPQNHIDRTRCRGHRNGSEEATRRPRDVSVREVLARCMTICAPGTSLAQEVVRVLQGQGHEEMNMMPARDICLHMCM